MWHLWHIGANYHIYEDYNICETYHICDREATWDLSIIQITCLSIMRECYQSEYLQECFHVIIQWGELVTTNPNPTENTEAHFRQRQYHYQDWRNYNRKEPLSMTGSSTKRKVDKKSQKIAVLKWGRDWER